MSSKVIHKVKCATVGLATYQYCLKVFVQARYEHTTLTRMSVRVTAYLDRSFACFKVPVCSEEILEAERQTTLPQPHGQTLA